VNDTSGGIGGGGSSGGGGGGGDGRGWGSLEYRYGKTANQGQVISVADIFRMAGFSSEEAWSKVDSLHGAVAAFDWVNRTFLPHLDTGGTILETGAAIVHKGEVVYNPSMFSSSGGGERVILIQTTVNMDSATIVRQTDRYKSGENALTSGIALPGGI